MVPGAYYDSGLYVNWMTLELFLLEWSIDMESLIELNSYFIRTAELWSSLPSEVKSLPSLNLFKNSLSNIYVSKIFLLSCL